VNFTVWKYRCSRNSELIVNTKNILQKLINLAWYNLLLSLNCFLHCCTSWGTVSLRWPPPFWIQKCTWVENLRVTHWSVSSEMLKISSRIFVSVNLSLQGDYSTLCTSNNPYRKSGTVWSGKWGGHVTSLKREITHCGNMCRSVARLITVMWAVVTSCLNHKLWFGGSFGAIEVKWSSLCNIVMWLWWLVCLHHQRSWVQWLLWPNSTTNGNFWVIKGCWWSS
jgi:hypothetical protein